MKAFILVWLTAIAVAKSKRAYSEEVEIPAARDGSVTSTGNIVEIYDGEPDRKPSSVSHYL